MAMPARSDSSVSATPPAKRIKYFPGLTAPHSSSSTVARFITASATATPRASEATSSSASAGALSSSDNAELVLERAAPLARIGTSRGEAVARRARDGPGRVALATDAKASIAGRVLDEERGVHRPRHVVQVVDALRVHHGGVEVAVLGLDRLADGDSHVLHAHHPQDRQQHLQLHEGMSGIDLGEQDARIAFHPNAGRLGDLPGVLADEVAVDLTVARHQQLFQAGESRAVHFPGAVADHLPLESVRDADR